MKNRIISIILTTVMAASLMSGCGQSKESQESTAPVSQTVEETAEAEPEEDNTSEETPQQAKVTIIYTNDIHTYMNNKGKDDDGNEYQKLTYASVKALKDDLAAAGENVILVDAGDHSQGTAYGSLDEGQTVIDIMNAVGYQAAAVGNHEFDYGQFRAFQIMDQANYPYISCNFYNVGDGSLVLPAYEIIEADGVKIAFVGISTPESIIKSTPAYFQDEAGKFIYDFYAGKDGQELYSSVQKAIDEVKTQADYVIALGHLGIDPSSVPYTSELVIQNTEGLDAFIDGHSHNTVEMKTVQDKAGNDVVLTQTGSYLNAIGKMTIDNGNIITGLITEYDRYDDEIASMSEAWVGEVDARLGESVAILDDTLYMNDPDTGNRMVRNQETNLGDFVADAYYYYFNEELDLDCDVALANGGGLRAELEPGDYTYMSSKSVCPFGNVACMVELTGQQLLDVLEMGARAIGLIDPETGKIAEIGGFMSVAGMKYSVDAATPSTIALDENNTWEAGPSGEYKVYDVEIYNKSIGKYEPIDLNKTYNVAGYNYHLRNQGDGFNMLKDTVVVQDYVMEDYLLVAEYAKAFAIGDDGMPHINTAGSPLSSYKGYLIDYEKINGAGRISIVME